MPQRTPGPREPSEVGGSAVFITCDHCGMTIQLAPGTGVADFAAIAAAFTTHELEDPCEPPEEQ